MSPEMETVPAVLAVRVEVRACVWPVQGCAAVRERHERLACGRMCAPLQVLVAMSALRVEVRAIYSDVHMRATAGPGQEADEG